MYLYILAARPEKFREKNQREQMICRKDILLELGDLAHSNGSYPDVNIESKDR